MGYFHNGCWVEVVSTISAEERLIVVVRDFRTDKMPYNVEGVNLVVNVKNLKEIVSDVFPIGTAVRNKKTLQFKGFVIGYEYETNMAVCRSKAIKNYRDDRVRYSYEVGDLEVYDANKVVLEPGRSYTWNNFPGKPCLVVEHPYDSKFVMLVSHTGKIVFHNVPSNTSKMFLAVNFGITDLKERAS